MWYSHQDGVSALVCLSELITRFQLKSTHPKLSAFYKSDILHFPKSRLEGENSSLSAQLDQLYDKYGLHTRWFSIRSQHLLQPSCSFSSLNSYYICHEPAVTAAIFTRWMFYNSNSETIVAICPLLSQNPEHGSRKGLSWSTGRGEVGRNVLLLMGNNRLALSSLWSQGDRGERSDNRLRLDAAGQEGNFARVCLQSDGEMENDVDRNNDHDYYFDHKSKNHWSWNLRSHSGSNARTPVLWPSPCEQVALSQR